MKFLKRMDQFLWLSQTLSLQRYVCFVVYRSWNIKSDLKGFLINFKLWRGNTSEYGLWVRVHVHLSFEATGGSLLYHLLAYYFEVGSLVEPEARLVTSKQYLFSVSTLFMCVYVWEHICVEVPREPRRGCQVP